MSDSGGSSGTADKPILDVFGQSGTIDCVVTIIRYSGGILLGSDELVHTCSSTASLTVKAARATRIMTIKRHRVCLECLQLVRLQQILA